MSSKLSSAPVSVTYDSHGEGSVSFSIKFNKATDFVGYTAARLWAQTKTRNDMDLFCLPTEIKCNRVDPRSHSCVPSRLSQIWHQRYLPTSQRCTSIPQREWHYTGWYSILADCYTLRGWRATNFLVQGWKSRKQPGITNKGKYTIHTGGRYNTYVGITLVQPR